MSTAETLLQLLAEETSPEALIAARGRAVAVGEQREVADQTLRFALTVYERLKQRRTRTIELSTLNDIATQLSSALPLPDLLRRVVDAARGLTGVDLAYLSLVGDECIVVEVTYGQVSSTLPGLRLPLGGEFVGALLRSGAPYMTEDDRADAQFSHDDQADAAALVENTRGLLGVPLIVRGTVIGPLFAAKRQERRFTTDEISLLVALASHASVAIDRSRSDELERRVAQDLHDAMAALDARRDEIEEVVAWDSRMSTILLRGGGVQEILTEASDRLGAQLRLVGADEDRPDDLSDVPEDLFIAAPPQRGDESWQFTGTDALYDVRPVTAGRTLGHLVAVCRAPLTSHSESLLAQTASGLALSMSGEVSPKMQLLACAKACSSIS